MKFPVRLLVLPLLLLASACATPQTGTIASTAASTDASVGGRAPVTILVSIDGFRPDYLERGLTPALSKLAAEGASAAMIPSFPTKTFPNHWTTVTGYHPDHHGITSNNFNDPARPEPRDRFTMATADPFFWNAKEPLWVTAERAGIRSAVMFWPGSSVAWGGQLRPRGYGRTDGGTRPTDWQAFDQNVSPRQRVNAIIDWLRRPAAIRPQLMFLYFDEVDTAGHDGGPDGQEIASALRNVDGNIADLLSGLEALGQPANIVIVSDHGMAETRSSRTIALDTILQAEDYTLDESGPFATMRAKPGRASALEEKLLKPHPHMRCWRREAIPGRLEYGKNPRVPPYLCLADTGWQILPSAPSEDRVGGNHGYDNNAPEMRALFIANGPAFRRGVTLQPPYNVDVTPMLRRVLGLHADLASDGQVERLLGALKD